MLLRITAKTLRESSLKFKKRKLTRCSKLSSIYSLEQASDHTWVFLKIVSQLKTHDLLKYRE